MTQTADGRRYYNFTIRNVFDLDRFRDDVKDYADRHCRKKRPTDLGTQQIADETGLDEGTIRDFVGHRRVLTVRVLCVLAMWADLSLDSYLKPEYLYRDN